jgi:hypothetical protein
MRTAEPSRARILLSLLFTTLLVLLCARPAAAARPVIPPNREAEVQALFHPHRLGDAVAPGWTLRSIEIDLATIRVWLAGPEEQLGELTLDHPDYAPPGSRPGKSFARAVIQQPPGSAPAFAVLLTALERNDDGRFWVVHGAIAADGEPASRFSDRLPGWTQDGLSMFVILAGITGALLFHALRQAPRWITGALLGVVVLGVLLRLTLTQATTLEPWSYTRFMVVARMIYEGPLLALLHPEPVYATSVITTTVLAYALVAPIPVFLMARYLLASDRAALICAGLIAVLPLHLRFSHGDVSSIPSLTLAALALAMVQAAAREPQLRWPLAMLALLAVPLLPAFLLRPLNILYAPLLLATAFIDRGIWSDPPPVPTRRLVAIAMVIAALTLGFGVPWLLAEFGREVREGLGLTTIASAIEVLFSFEYNSLINPRFTPPGLTALSLLGVVDLVKRKRWRLVVFLAGWLLASLATHAYVVPKSPFMQARYHLHLVVPFVCLAACGIEALLTRLRGHRRARLLTLGLFGYLVASPAIHAGFIRDVDFNDQREWAWVHDLREKIPTGCTIVEYGGRAQGARFARVGAHVIDGMPSKRWMVIEIPAPTEPEPEPEPKSEAEPTLPDEVRELLRAPPECAYWYEGMPCFGNRPPQTAIAPACAAVHELVTLHEVERLELASRPYDENLARGLQEGEAIVLTVFRMRPRAEHAVPIAPVEP